MTAADEDGAVVVPPALANTVFVAVVAHLHARTRDGGATLTPEARTLLRDLHRAASGVSTIVDTGPSSSEGSHVDGSDILGAHEVADLLGCSRRWATVLLSSGRLGSRRVGRAWVTTRGDLDAYRYGREEAPHAERESAGEGRKGRRRPPGQDREGTAATA